MIYLLLADGFEEMEALAPLDLLKRAGAEILTVAIGTETPVGSHGVRVFCDLNEKDADLSAADMIILPGGMPGSKNLDASPFVDKAIQAVSDKGGRLAAICAAPLVLGRRGLLKGKTAVCYPGFERELEGAIISDSAEVVTDGCITTAKGAGVAFDFGLELVRLLFGEEKADELKRSTMRPEGGATVLHVEEETAECTETQDSTEAQKSDEGYSLPSPALLAEGEAADDTNVLDEIREVQETLIETFMDYNVNVSIREVERGPRVTRYAVVPGKGVKVNKVLNYIDDVTLALGAKAVRAEVLAEKCAIGIEIPNKKPTLVRLRELLEHEDFRNAEKVTTVCIGKDVTGKPVFGDIAKMPHMLIAGASGMGKSVSIHSLLISLLYKANPEELKLILIDPKKVEFNVYNDIPHLLAPVISDANRAAAALRFAVEEMERRYDKLQQLCVRNIDTYNERVKQDVCLGKPMPRIVIVIDELADLMMQVRDPAENLIMSIAQKARAAGIHLIIGTQRPSVNVITGVIKANIPTRLSCKVSSTVDSRTIMERAGAETLLNNGDMLYHPIGLPDPIRVQGAFISDREVEEVLTFIKDKNAAYETDTSLANALQAALIFSTFEASEWEDIEEDEEEEDGFLSDEKFLAGVAVAIENGKVGTSLLQRKLGIGYSKAAIYIDAMEALGIISEANGSKPRDVLITMDEWKKRLGDAD